MGAENTQNKEIQPVLVGAEKQVLSKRTVLLWRLGLAAICLPLILLVTLSFLNGFDNAEIRDLLYLFLDILGSLVCIFLYYGRMSAMYAPNTTAAFTRAFITTLFLSAATFLLDTLISIFGGFAQMRKANLIFSTLFFVSHVLLIYNFWRSARAVLRQESKLVRWTDIVLRFLLMPALVLCISNLFSPVFFSIDEYGYFEREAGYPLGGIYMLVAFVLLLLILISSDLSIWQKITTTLFMLIPFAIFYQTRNMPDLAVSYTAASISVLLICCVLFSERIHLKEMVIRIFSLFLLLAMLICGPMIYTVSLRITAWVGHERAQGAFDLTDLTLDEVGLDVLQDPANKEKYQETRAVMRKICRSFRLENLYVEVIDPEDGSRSFVIAVSNTDENDLYMQKVLGWPGASLWNENSYLREPEIIALSGSISGVYSEEDNEFGHNIDWFYPYLDKDENVIALIGADYDVLTQQLDAIEHTIANILPVLVLYVITLIVLLIVLNQTFIHPIKRISLHIQQFVSNGTPNTKSPKVGGGQEIIQLADSFDVMTSELNDYEEKLAKETAERERLRVELNLASSIQANHLPSHFPPFPDRHEFDINASMQPAKEVGGDFYDFFLIDADHLALMVADVSGKGVPAALYMMLSKTMLNTATQLGFSPAGVLEKVNEQLAADNDDNMFVTVWLGVLEISTGILTYADAGHEKLILYQNHEWMVLPKSKDNKPLPLGMLERPEIADPLHPKYYYNQSLVLAPGDVILQYSDGVTDAVNEKDQFFGEKGLLDALNSADSADPESLLPHIRSQIKQFAGSAQPFDDITMLCLRYNGYGSAD